MRLTRFRRAAILTLTAGTMLGTSGCFGSFNLTRKLYGFNKSVSSDKFVRELVFLGLNVVPIYSIAGFVDAVVANSVEFWTGKNPIEMASTMKLDSATTVKRVVAETNGVRTMTLTVYKSGARVATTTVEYVPGTNYMTFATVLADGRTETHVTAMGADGKAFVSAATHADLLRAGAVVAY